MRAALAAGLRSVRDGFAGCKIKCLQLTPDEAPRNLNTPQDYQEWLSTQAQTNPDEGRHDIL
jgi:hypothetical protein